MFDDIFEEVSSTRTSKYFDELSRDEQTHLVNFVEWLVREHNFKLASARSYKSNVSRAIYKVRHNEKLTSDEKSGVRKFETYMKTLA